nr:endonuclease III [uncultured Schaedlerella sp.]
MIKENTQKILNALDKEYGTVKEGFVHTADWQLLTAIMLSAQSTDKQVDEALPGLWARFPDISAILSAPLEDIEEAIKSIGLYKVKARNIRKCCEMLCEKHDGKVPKTIEELVKLPGVGRKTATLFLADAYGIPGVTVDTHVFRISKRIGWAAGSNPVQVEKELMKALPKEHWNRINFQLIYHGRSVCTARKARCEKCILQKWCETAMSFT